MTLRLRGYVISLLRRPERRARMKAHLSEVGFPAHEVELFRAIDAREVSEAPLAELGVTLFPTWRDPISSVGYHARDLKWGEIGCSLSHLEVWRRIAAGPEEVGLVLEDDAVLTDDGRERLLARLGELAALRPDWDLLYLGRKRLRGPPFVADPDPGEAEIAPGIVVPTFSYCTHAYALSRAGARKLLEGGLERALIPVDEYVPAMYTPHPRADVRAAFGQGDRLKAFAAEPPLARAAPAGSDTEGSSTVAADVAPAAAGLGGLLGEHAGRFLEEHWPRRTGVWHLSVDRLGLPPALFDPASLLRTPGLGLSLFGKNGLRAGIGSPADAAAFFGNGDTIYLLGLDKAFPQLRAVCRALAADLELDPAHVSVEGFVSPAGAGSSMHYDFDINFNVQLTGTKTWRVAENEDVVNPLRSLPIRKGAPAVAPFDGRLLRDEMPPGAVTSEVGPGAVVFLPRGIWHETAVRSDSVAIAFVIKPAPFFHLVCNELAQRLAADPAWRAFPVEKDRAQALDGLLRALPGVVSTMRAEELLFHTVRVRWAPGAIARFEQLTEPRHGERWSLAVHGGEGELDLEIPVAEVLVPAVSWLVQQREAFSSDGLVGACPGTSPGLARKIVGYLVDAGAMTRAL